MKPHNPNCDMTPQNTDANCRKLAEDKIEAMDLETMQQILIDLFVKDYRESPEYFAEEWKHFFEEA